MPLSQNCTLLLKASSPHVEFDASLTEKFSLLYDRITRLNQKINVTALNSMPEAVLKHFADSLTLLKLKEFELFKDPACFDIGCGGGFPGLPIALVKPQLKLTMIDSTEKKITALKQSCDILGLEKIRPVAGRAEELAAANGLYREKGDLVFSRALARLDVLCELCLPFVKPGGYFIAMKGRDAQSEIKEAAKAITTLKAKLVRAQETTLPEDFCSGLELNDQELAAAAEFAQSKRYLVVIKKLAPCDGRYPRRFAQIKKSPL